MLDIVDQFEFDFRRWLKNSCYDFKEDRFSGNHFCAGITIDHKKGIQLDEEKGVYFVRAYDQKNYYGIYRVGDSFAPVLQERRLKVYLIQPERKKIILITNGYDCLFMDGEAAYTIHGVPLIQPNAIFELKKISADTWYNDFHCYQHGSWVEYDQTIENMIADNTQSEDSERDCWLICET